MKTSSSKYRRTPLNVVVVTEATANRPEGHFHELPAGRLCATVSGHDQLSVRQRWPRATHQVVRLPRNTTVEVPRRSIPGRFGRCHVQAATARFVHPERATGRATTTDDVCRRSQVRHRAQSCSHHFAAHSGFLDRRRWEAAIRAATLMIVQAAARIRSKACLRRGRCRARGAVVAGEEGVVVFRRHEPVETRHDRRICERNRSDFAVQANPDLRVCRELAGADKVDPQQ
eukprot:2611496-Rhodomonas_salina.1